MRLPAARGRQFSIGFRTSMVTVAIVLADYRSCPWIWRKATNSLRSLHKNARPALRIF